MAQAEANLATVEGIKAGADAAFWAATWLVPGGGTVSMAYGAGVGYAEGGIVGAVATSARAYSDVLDIGLAAVNGALEVDDAGQRRGVGGALQAGLSTAVLNKLTNALAGKTTGFVQGAIGRARPVKAPVGEGPRPEAFKDNHERYADALKAASTPAQRQAVAQQFRVVAAREQLRSELADVTRRHEQAIPLTARGPDGSILGAVITLFIYGLLPLAIVLYLLATPARRKALRAREAAEASARQPDRSGHAAGDAVAPEREEA